MRWLLPLLIAALGVTAACREKAAGPATTAKATATASESASPTLSVRGLPLGKLEITRQNQQLANLVVEIAETPAAEARGLMGVEKLPAGSGMVFLFSSRSSGPFYMKDTLIPLDIAFWDESAGIVDILQMQPCRAEPCTYYYSRSPYVGAVETNLNYMSDHGVLRGDRAILSR